MKTKIFTFAVSLTVAFSIGGVGGALLTSCSSWIEEDTGALVTDQSVGDSKESLDMWVTGVYSKWVYDNFCWGYFPKVLEMDADYISGPDWLFGKFGAGTFQGESDVTDALWKGAYGVIERANNAIRHIRGMSGKGITDEIRQNAIGEMYFHKAFSYFLLVRAYGSLPLIPVDETPDYKGNPRASVVKVYTEIFTLLEQAANMMYKNTDAAYSEGHVCAGSAAGLLAKAYATAAASAMPTGTEITVRTGPTYEDAQDAEGRKIYKSLSTRVFAKQAVKGYEELDAQKLYAEAAKWAKAVIEGTYGAYSLLDYDKLWKKEHRYDSEFMFSVYVPNNDKKYKMSIHSQYEGYMTSTGSDFIASGGWIGCTRHWYDLFDSQDLRITKGVKHRWRNKSQQEWNTGFFYPLNDEYCIMATGKKLNGQTVGNPSGIYADGVNYEYKTSDACLAFTTKYMDVTDDAVDNADAPWPFLRYADVILIAAEALNETEGPDAAVNYLNMVRERSNAKLAVLSGNGAITDKNQMRSTIIEERAKELACEADRRWDLIRWGIYLDAMNAIGGYDDGGVLKNRQSQHLLFPIPTQEMNTNKSMTQNPGWS